MNASQEVIINGKFDVTLIFNILLQVCSIHYTLSNLHTLPYHSTQLPRIFQRCPDQRLMAQTYPRSNMTDVTTQHEQVIEGSDTTINSTYTVSIARKQHCSANFKVVGNEGITEEYLMPLNFSEWSIVLLI